MSHGKSNIAPGVVRTSITTSSKRHVCPVWIGYLLASPLRRWFENPERMLEPAVKPGQLALDVGCAMGFFTLPLARLVGPQGRVVAVDVQANMIERLERRLSRHGLRDRVETRLADERSLPVGDLRGRVDVAVAIHMVHEVPDAGDLFAQVAGALKRGGVLVFAEPRGHVSSKLFDEELALSAKAGFEEVGELPMRRTFHRLLRKA